MELQKNTAKLGNPEGESDSFNSKREVYPEDYPVAAASAAAESKDWIQQWSKHMADEQKHPIIVTTERPVESPATVKVQPMIGESALKQLVQLYKKSPPKQELKDDSVIQFQDRHKVVLKRPTQEKLDHFIALKQHDKKKVTEDLMDVDLE